MRIIDINSKNSLNKAAQILRQNGILVFPTDTVYGIGCLMKEKTIKRLYKIKNRPLTQPTAILLTSKIYTKICSSMIWYRNIPINIKRDYWDGKITIVFPASIFKLRFPEIITKASKIGIRLPHFRWLEKLIDLVGPIVASSANKKGKPSPAKFSEIDARIIKEVDLIIKTEDLLEGQPSRVFDPETKKYIR